MQHYVFLVDDDDGVRELMAAVLVAGGYIVVTAEHGLDALKKLDAIAATPDAILTDFEMPFMKGDELVTRLRKHSRFANVPIAIVSGLARLSPGADCVLRKPLFPEVLLRTVKHLCTRTLPDASSTGSASRFHADAYAPGRV